MIRQPFTERDIQRIARGYSVKHYSHSPSRISNSRNRGAGRLLLLLLLALLFALVVWLTVVVHPAGASPALSATWPLL